jgi:hypothetical protein
MLHQTSREEAEAQVTIGLGMESDLIIRRGSNYYLNFERTRNPGAKDRIKLATFAKDRGPMGRALLEHGLIDEAMASERTPGDIYKGSEHRMDVLYRSMSRDWPRVLAIIAVVKGALLLVLLCFRQFRQLAAMLFCLGAGVAGAYYASPYAQPHLQRWVPVDFRPDLLAYVAGFVAAYIVALMIVVLIRAPFAASRE